MTSVDVCRLNKFDNPDFVYGRHDGTILKRLFSAFSFRPTVVATLPVANLFAYNPYAQNMRPVVTSIPMINVRLSNFGMAAAAAAAAAAGRVVPANQLSTALSQTNQFLEGNAVVNRHTSVMFSNEVLVFYIDRRSYAYTAVNSAANIARLPTSIAGFERINDIAIDYESRINVGNDVFTLTSAVVADVNNTLEPNSKFVVGSDAIIMDATSAGPLASLPILRYTPGTVISRKSTSPIEAITIDPAIKLITTQGIVLVYVNKTYTDSVYTFNM